MEVPAEDANLTSLNKFTLVLQIVSFELDGRSFCLFYKLRIVYYDTWYDSGGSVLLKYTLYDISVQFG